MTLARGYRPGDGYLPGGMLRVVEDHLRSTQVSHVIDGAIIGLALVVALDQHPPRPAVMVGTLLATGLAVRLAELYSEIVDAEVPHPPARLAGARPRG